MMNRELKTLLCVGILMSVFFLLNGTETTRASMERPTISVYYGQSDSEIISQLPDLDLGNVGSDDSSFAPALVFSNGPVLGSDIIFSTAQLGNPINFPDTLLLYSKGFYGDSLNDVVQLMGLPLDAEDMRALETLAAVRGVNTRLLLVLSMVKGAPDQFDDYQDWLKWLYVETSRIRSSLGPFDQEQIIRFTSGECLSASPEIANTTYWYLLTSLASGQSYESANGLMGLFVTTYQQYFGDPTVDEASAPATTGFLYKPYQVPLTDRGYYDHQYPSIDNLKNPNIGGMLDYLGRTYTKYDSHDGDDFWMPYGSAVYAPQNGQIANVFGSAQNLGLVMWYANDTSYEIVINHLSSRLINAWETVTQGQLIGYSGWDVEYHIHFEVRHNGRQVDTMGWYGGGSDPCPAGPGPFSYYKGCETSVWLWADECFPDALPPVTTALVNGTPGDNGWTMGSVTVSFTADDGVCGSGINNIRYRIDGGVWTVYSTLVPIQDGLHTIEYQALDNANHWEDVKSLTLKVDSTPPQNPATAPGCSASSDIWQTTCNDANFTWSGASDATSGLAGYEYDWGPNSGGNPPAVWTTGMSFDPTAVTEGSYYLRIRTKDNAGNWSSWQTAFILRYDATAPTGSLLINNDATTSYATLVRLQGAASDATSGVSQMRIRDTGGTWYDWQAFMAPMYWLLPATSGQTHTVEIQYQDRAGNLSLVYSDSIFLNVYPDRPSSESYDLLRSTWSASWSGTYPESANYVLKGTFGQPSMVGNMHSSLYVICSGYWSTPCNPTFTYTNFLPLITR